MLDRTNAAMVDAAASTAVPLGCRTLCQHPGCGQPIEAGPDGWFHVHRQPDTAAGWHRATPVEQPELSPGERLVASVQRSYERHRRGRPVHPLDVVRMAERMGNAVYDRGVCASRGDLSSPAYQRAVRAHNRRWDALYRLAYALERQAGGDLR